MYYGGRWGNLRKMSLDTKMKSYPGAAAWKQQVEIMKSQIKNWETFKTWTKSGQKFGYVNSVYFVLEDTETTNEYCSTMSPSSQHSQDVWWVD